MGFRIFERSVLSASRWQSIARNIQDFRKCAYSLSSTPGHEQGRGEGEGHVVISHVSKTLGASKFWFYPEIYFGNPSAYGTFTAR